MRTLRAHDTSTHTRGARGARAEFVLFVNRLPIVQVASQRWDGGGGGGLSDCRTSALPHFLPRALHFGPRAP